ncbi:cytidylyltransferase domain-containing protein [Thermoanaerobacterium sp. DL9XJH110]|uniref:acylneuraminate cytidylyltransferase family protein n=1 Tax=Thermoanaerobacterium sp. DL9XJH110 TaxID=3386643 RepID=UPI003BB717D2
MYQDKKILAIIPARAGSKGIPGKNIKSLAGKPLITYTIEVAQKSEIFDYILVSTDGREIAELAKKAGAQVPFIRPAELASDGAKSIDVIHHAMRWLEQNDMIFDWLMYLQPTSPLRAVEDILSSCELMLKRKAEAIVSVCEVDYNPFLVNTLPKDLCMANFIRPELQNINRQQLPVYYRINGAIYLSRWDFIKKSNTWYGPKTYAYIMPKMRSIDIDDVFDFKFAEFILENKESLR